MGCEQLLYLSDNILHQFNLLGRFVLIFHYLSVQIVVKSIIMLMSHDHHKSKNLTDLMDIVFSIYCFEKGNKDVL